MEARGRRYVHTLLAALVLTVTATIATHSWAMPPWSMAQPKMDFKTKNEARKAYAAGKAKLSKGDYAGALEDFRTADRLVPGAAPKYQIAVCLDKLGNIDEAVAAYRTFIDSQPGEKYAAETVEAGKRISELEAQLEGKVKITVTPADAQATITVDGAPVEGTEISLKAGTHTVVVSAKGYQDATQTVEVKGGGTAE